MRKSILSVSFTHLFNYSDAINWCKKLFIEPVKVWIPLLLISISGYSQQEANNWLVGNFGLDFSADTVVVRHDYAQHANRGIGIISDSNGRLLCYTDGMNCWNRKHLVMPNGQNMSTTQSGTNVQSSAIIPKPGSDSIYYSFTVHPDNGHISSGLYYSVIDMTKDNGYGDATLKGKKIQDRTDNKLTAVYHQNGRDIWVITHQHNTNKYFSYLLTESGLIESPVISATGKSYISATTGQLKASPDGSKIACSYDAGFTAEGFSLFNFDNATGQLSNPLIFSMPVPYRGCGGIEFSPDATKIYVYQNGSIGEGAVYQYDISTYNHVAIQNSRISVLQPMENQVLEMQLAANGEIYLTKGGGQSDGAGYLGVIKKPNKPGTECSSIEKGLYLNGSSAFTARTPAFIQNYFFKTSFIFQNTCSSSPADFKITNELGLDSVRWDFGGGNFSVSRRPQFSFTTPGNHIITLLAHYPTKTDTIRKTIRIYPTHRLDLGKDTTVCFGYELAAETGHRSYSWNTGDSTQTILISQSGTYRLTVENEFGCRTTDSVNIQVIDLPHINLPDSIELGALMNVSVNAGNFKSYRWSTGDTTPTITLKDEGWYSITVENETGCQSTKSFYVYTHKTAGENPYQWNYLHPKPSSFHGLGIHFLDSQTGFILNDQQLIATTDGGDSWKPKVNLKTGKFIAFKNKYGYIVCGSGEIYKSTYMGGGWSKLPTLLPETPTGLSVISKDTVIVTGTYQLHLSVDGGRSWTSANIIDTPISSSCFTSTKVGHTGYANGRIYKTTDGGKTWNLKNAANSLEGSVNKLYFVDDYTGYFTKQNSTKIFKTTDGGETWKAIPSLSDKIYTFHFINTQFGFCAGTQGVIYKTSNGGESWEWAGFQKGKVASTDIYGIYFINNSIGFATGHYGRIVKTTDGGKTWKEYASSYSTIRQLKVLSDSLLFGLAGTTIIKSNDGGNSWATIETTHSTGDIEKIDFLNEATGYYIAKNNEATTTIYKTSDGGKTWIANQFQSKLSNNNITSLHFTDHTTGFISGGIIGNYATYKTTDGGTTWQKVNDLNFTSIKFISQYTGYGHTLNKLYKTTDGGETWSKLSIPVENTGLNSFDFIDTDRGYISGTTSGSVYKTTDGGTTWQKLALPTNIYHTIRFYTANIGFSANTKGQLFQTSNGGESWSIITDSYQRTGFELVAGHLFLYGNGGFISRKKIDFKPVELYAQPAQSVTSNSVTLSGNATANTHPISSLKFEYGIGSFTNWTEVQPDTVAIGNSTNTQLTINGLQSNQRYTFRLSAIANGASIYSQSLEFTTLPDFTITYEPVKDKSTNHVVLNAKIHSISSDLTDIEFQYSTDTSFTNSVGAQPAVIPKGTTGYVKALISNLTPGSKYIGRIKAKHNGKSVYSNSIVHFYTDYSHIFSFIGHYVTNNTLNIKIYITANQNTMRDIVLEYGTTRDYSNRKEIWDTIPKGNSIYVIPELTGLDSTKVYFYRIKAKLGSETVYSDENITTMKKENVLIPIEHKQLSDSSVLLQGLVHTNLSYPAKIRFRYGTTTSLNDSVNITTSFPSYVITQKVTATVNQLIPGIPYYVRLKASDLNLKSDYYSELYSFTLVKTGIRDENYATVTLFPNPFSEYLTVHSSMAFDKIEIIDLTGKVHLISTTDSTIHTALLPDGMYLLRIHAGGKVLSRKIIKN